jgi:hypothetical protein
MSKHIIAQPVSLHAVNSRAATWFRDNCERDRISLMPEVIAPFGYYPALSTKSAPWVENRIHLSA